MNRFRQKVEIAGTQQSCGCSTVAISAKYLEPGEKAILSALWKTGSSRGMGEVTIRVFYTLCEDGTRYELPLSMRGNVLADIKFRPDPLVFSAGISSVSRVQFEPGALDKITIEAPYASHRCLKVRMVGECQIEVAFDSSEIKGLDGFSPYVAVKTNSVNEPLLRVFAKIQVNDTREKEQQ